MQSAFIFLLNVLFWIKCSESNRNDLNNIFQRLHNALYYFPNITENINQIKISSIITKHKTILFYLQN